MISRNTTGSMLDPFRAMIPAELLTKGSVAQAVIAATLI